MLKYYVKNNNISKKSIIINPYGIIIALVKTVLVSISVASCIMGIHILLLNRTLWLDEASLAYSIVTRSLRNMTAVKLDYNQTAPVLYLYTIKTLTMLFGNSEIILRLFSYISFIGVLILLFIIPYLLTKKDQKMNLPFKFPMLCYLCPAVFSILSISLRYATELKPYMSDAFFTLLAIFFYLYFQEKKITLRSLTLVYCVLLWYSSPVIFIIAAVLIYEFFNKLANNDYKNLILVGIAGMIILVSFVVNYFYWLRDVATYDEMVIFWENNAMPKFPHSIKDLIKIVYLCGKVVKHFGIFMVVYSILALTGIIMLFLKKEPLSKIIVITAVLLYVASSFEKYPIEDRLMVFCYPLIVILVCFAMTEIRLSKKKLLNNVVKISLTVCLIITNPNWIEYYKNPYIYGEEASKLIFYVDENIQHGESLYLYNHAVRLFDYISSYNDSVTINNLQKSGNVMEGNVYWNDKNDIEAEINMINERSDSYVLFYHMVMSRITPLVDGLNASGFLEPIMISHNTPLYFYTTDISHIKTNAEYELIRAEIENDQFALEIKIKNTGKTIWQMDKNINLSVRAINKDNGTFYEDSLSSLPYDVVPGDEVTIKGVIKIPNDLSVIHVGLVKEGKYRFSEIGVADVIVPIKSL